MIQHCTTDINIRHTVHVTSSKMPLMNFNSRQINGNLMLMSNKELTTNFLKYYFDVDYGYDIAYNVRCPTISK